MKQFHLKKLMVVGAALGSLAVLGSLSVPGTSQAATSSANFVVSINLTSACTFTNITTVDFAYTSSQGGAQGSTGGTIDVTCPLNLAYTSGLVAGVAPGAPAASIIVTDNAVGLQYTLNAPTGGPGTGAADTKTISGTMNANQPGTCASAACTNAAATNRTHQLVVTF